MATKIRPGGMDVSEPFRYLRLVGEKMNQLNMNTQTFSVDEWAAAMMASVSEIDELGRELVARHRQGSERAEEVCRNWRLEERPAEQHIALGSLFAAAREILESLVETEILLQADTMASAAQAIEENLPTIEEGFLAVRHCAQDLLHWADRYGTPENSGVTASYRAAHDKLISFAPVFKPRLETLQAQLLGLVESDETGPAVRRLLSAITRYNAVLDSARRFVAVVVEPPLELVFAETGQFLEDVQEIPLETRGLVGSELNDCCRSLLYEPAIFARAVKAVETKQPEGIDSSLVVLESHGLRILFTVEEDPIFGQLTVHLLRAVGALEFDSACAGVSRALAEEWE